MGCVGSADSNGNGAVEYFECAHGGAGGEVEESGAGAGGYGI